MTIHWREDGDFQKDVGQLRLQLGEIMTNFCIYGLDPLVKGAIEEQIEVAIDFSLRVRGKDHPILLKNRRNPRR